jgi:cytoskeletal protein CcmA (bactofilin family)
MRACDSLRSLRIVRAEIQAPQHWKWESEMSPAESSSASIGKSVEIRGEVKGSEDLMVDGHVEGTVTLTDSRLTIGLTARVHADVSARDIVILGTLNGNATATGKLELRKGANVTGDIRAARLSIEEGSILCGKVDLTQQVPGSVPVSKAAPTAVPASVGASASSTTSAVGTATPGSLFSPATKS